jgi:hypothetical protein
MAKVGWARLGSEVMTQLGYDSMGKVRFGRAKRALGRN